MSPFLKPNEKRDKFFKTMDPIVQGFLLFAVIVFAVAGLILKSGRILATVGALLILWLAGRKLAPPQQ